MKANKVYGVLGTLAAMAVCTTAFAQGGPPPDDGQGEPPPDMRQDQGGGPGGPGGQGMRRMGPPMEPLFMRPDVQKELKLTDDQIEKLRDLMPRPPMGGPGGPPDQDGQSGGGRGGQ